MMELKIISDGTPFGTKVVDSKTGEEIEGARSIEWSISYDELSIAKIELGVNPIEVIGSKTKIVKPKKKESKLLEFDDNADDLDNNIPF